MKKLYSILLLLALFVSGAFAETTTWKVDKAHSSVQFTVTHMVISSVTGKFKKFDGEIKSENADFKNAKIKFTIDAESIDTDNQKRDDHLKSPDFFDSAKYPQIKFESTSFEKIEANKYKLTGNFTMKDITKNITLEVVYTGSVKDAKGNSRAGFKISGTVNRFDYHLQWNKTIEAGGLVVGKDVDFVCYMELQNN
jgi:polyisoprenoid-binding protein YceI